MDISSQTTIERHLLRRDMRAVHIPNHPLTPWLRIANSYTTAGSHALDYARLRTISDYEVILQVEGSTWFWIEDHGSIDISPGDVLFIPPGFVHGQAHTQGTHAVAHFDLHAKPDLAPYHNLHPMPQIVRRRPSALLPVFSIVGPPQRAALTIPLVTAVRAPHAWRDCLDRLASIHARERPLSLSDQASVCEAVGWMLRTLVSDSVQMDISSQARFEERITALLPDFERDRSLSVAAMAARAGMGETAFRQTFERLTGRTPHAFVEERRIARATHLLLATDLPVKDIALSCGYDDPYHFSRVFRRVTNASPREFRRKVAGR